MIETDGLTGARDPVDCKHPLAGLFLQMVDGAGRSAICRNCGLELRASHIAKEHIGGPVARMLTARRIQLSMRDLSERERRRRERAEA